jgi:hypothetical protein
VLHDLICKWWWLKANSEKLTNMRKEKSRMYAAAAM